MADPITGFGAAAGALQFADAALRASREAYGFLAAVKNASRDVRDMRDALYDVDMNARSLRNYIAAFSKSANAIEEFEVLSETITGALTKFRSDVDVIKSILPPEASPNLAQKMKWVYRKTKVKGITERLLNRKADLVVALSITGRLHDLRLRQDVADLRTSSKVATDKILRQQQQLSPTAVSGHVSILDDHVRGQRKNYVQLIEEIEKSRICLDSINTKLHDTKSQPIYSNLDTDMLANILRSELHSFFKPLLASTCIESENHTDATSYNAEGMADTRNLQIQDSPNGPWREKQFGGQRCETKQGTALLHRNQHPKSQDQCAPVSTLYNNALEVQPTHTFSSFKRSWCIAWKIGSIRVELVTTTHRKDGCPESDLHFSIYIHVRPCHALLLLPGLSTFYSSMPNTKGFYQIAPMVTIFPIISREHPVSNAISRGDLRQLQEMFASRKASPKCQYKDGTTLLHYAVAQSQPEICRYLLSLDQSMYQQRDWLEMTPIHDAVGLVFELFCTLTHRYSAEKSIRNVLASLRILEDECENLNAVYEDLIQYRYRFSFFVPKIPVHILFIGFEHLLSRHGAIAWRLLFSILKIPLFRPSQEAAEIMKLCLQKGLDPNFTTQGLTGSLLMCAIVEMGRTKGELIPTEDTEAEYCASSGEKIKDMLPETTESPLWAVVKTLVEAGADIFHMNSSDFDIATDWTHIRDLWWYADDGGVLLEWEAALEECGIVHDEAYKVGKRRVKQAFRLRGARRTGVDEEHFALPSFAGLRRRACCWKNREHDEGPGP